MAITIPIITDYYDKGAKAAKKSFGELDSAAKGLAKTFAAAFAVDRIVSFGQQAVKAALDDARSQALLAEQLKTTLNATSAMVAENEKFITSLMMASNFADDQLRPALAQLTRATGDLGSAQNLLALATDVAVGSQRDLDSVVMALSKAALGQTTALKRLGVPLSETALVSGDLTTITKELAAVYGGQAKLSTETLAGRLENLKLRWDEQVEAIGTRLLPALEKVTVLLDKYLGSVEGGEPIIKAAARGLFDYAKAVLSPSTYLRAGIDLLDRNSDAAADNAAQWADSAVAFANAANGVQDLSRSLQTNTALTSANSIGVDALKMKFKLYFQNLRLTKQLQDGMNGSVKTGGTVAKETATIYNNFALALKDVQGRILDVNKGIAAQIMSAATLGSALSTATANDENLKSALEERRQAYADLARLDPAKDALELADAWNKVGQAEMNVRDAAAKPRDYVSIFRDQIAKAKEFGATLQKLVKAPYNLGAAGLQQLLDLGPLAGGEVAKELLVTGGRLSVGELNTSLADLSAVTTGVGGGMGGNVYNIRIESVIADKDAVSREVVKALENYEKRFGAIPVTTRGR
jgi:hypothetical protein